MSTIIQIIAGIWLFYCLIFLCFKDHRDRIKSIAISFCSECVDIYQRSKEENGILVACLVLLVFVVCVPLLMVIVLLTPLYFCFLSEKKPLFDSAISNIDVQDEQMIWQKNHFVSYFYPGKVSFDFDSDTFIYVESGYNEHLNHCINSNYEKIQHVFQQYNFRFIYVPLWNPDMSLLDHTTIDEKHVNMLREFPLTTVQYTKQLCLALRIEFETLECGLFHFACYLHEGEIQYSESDVDKTKFTNFRLYDLDEYNVTDYFKKYCEYIQYGRKHYGMGGPCMSVISKFSEAEYYERMGHSQQEIVDYKFPKDMKDIAEDIKRKIERLKDGGYFELLVHTLGRETLNELSSANQTPSLSRLQITDDFKIMLIDFDKEIRMTPLQKTLYIFYLRHPEGVEFKMLSVYYTELLEIYKVLSNREDFEKQNESIRMLVDVTDNAINEKCSRIKEAFLKVTDDFVAKNYYITTYIREYKEVIDSTHYLFKERLKRITLPSELIIYPGEIAKIKVLVPKAEIRSMELKFRANRNRYSELYTLFCDKSYSKGMLVREFTEFINNNPKHYASYFYRAILYTHIGMYREAIADNDVLIEHNEILWVDAIINKSEALFFLKLYEEALVIANHYFEIENVPVAESYRIRSAIYKKMKMQNESIADRKMYKKVLNSK